MLSRALRSFAASFPRAGRVLRYFLPYVWPHLGALAGALALGGAVAVTEVLRPWPLQVVFDRVLAPRPGIAEPFGLRLGNLPPMTLVAGAAAAIVVISLLGGLAAYAQTILLSNAGQRVIARIRRDLFRHMMKLPVGFHTGRRHGDLLMRLTGDIVLLRELLVGSLLDAFAALLTLGGTLAVMLWLEPGLTLLTLGVVPPVALAASVLSRRIRRTVRRTREKEGGLASHAGEALGAVAVLQAYGAVGRVAERFERENRSGLRAGLKASRLEAMLTRSLDLLTSVGVGATLALGAWSVSAGRLSPGGLLVFLAYQRNLYRPIRQLARLAARSAKSSACGERIVEILETVPEVTDRPDARPCPPLRGEIRFENVTLRYPRGDLALSNVDLLVPAGTTVAIRGESGAGKTTLISLLPRLLDPSEGRVLVDGCDLREFTLDSLRAQVSMVFQESVLLGLSVRENVALGRPGATAEEVEEAARRAGVMRFAPELPQGLDTVVGERGALLSGGQRQRVALARAGLRPASILVLDEPFAHLDESSRDHVIEALHEIATGRTVLIVTHGDHPGLRPDLEVVLRGGRLADCFECTRDGRATLGSRSLPSASGLEEAAP